MRKEFYMGEAQSLALTTSTETNTESNIKQEKMNVDTLG